MNGNGIGIGDLNAIFLGKRKKDLFNTSVTSGSNWFSEDVVADKDCLMRITVALDTATALTVVITRGDTTITPNYNRGNSLNANALYAWDINLKAGDSFNLRCGADATVLVCAISEIDYAA